MVTVEASDVEVSGALGHPTMIIHHPCTKKARNSEDMVANTASLLDLGYPLVRLCCYVVVVSTFTVVTNVSSGTLMNLK